MADIIVEYCDPLLMNLRRTRDKVLSASMNFVFVR